MKNPNNWRRFSPQLLGSVEKADVKATRLGQLLVVNFVGQSGGESLCCGAFPRWCPPENGGRHRGK